MFLLMLALLLGVIGLFCYGRYKFLKVTEEKETDWISGVMVFWFFSMVIFISSFVITGANYSKQLSDFEDLKKFDNLEIIYEQKANELTKRFTKILLEIYPQHEKEIFNKISPEKVDIYLVKYPELKTSRTVILLTEQINGLQSDRYEQMIKKECVLKDIRFRLRNPWIWYWFIPEK